ncbi:uncharacterized protein LOC132943104 [Metopolophium dirhodum]|uniref:uncharacterized protein LOC132942970 n=1 Tax=Metopolophium dirhodum TaxID=44670 RepID=UPI00298FE5FE|nr:uncharacterized protein LOC132942970 [Metopolophium dirhodum]XP_060867895.1 uncharacterized protein LOC132943104 [Metopolophium dirhodum]
MNFLSIVLVIALVGYSLGAPQYGHNELDNEYEHINAEHHDDGTKSNCKNRKNGDSQEQDEGTNEGRGQGRGNKQVPGRYLQPELGGYYTPVQQYYANNPGYVGGSDQYYQGWRLPPYSQGGPGLYHPAGYGRVHY